MTTKVLEIFNSISGEVTPYYQGCLTTFVRLAGCNLHCTYCDTPTAHDKGNIMETKDFVPIVRSFYENVGKLCITGGEPLLQQNTVDLLLKTFNNCWIETNGTIDFNRYVGTAAIIADFKLEVMKEIPSYFYNLGEHDFVKFVVKNSFNVTEAQLIQRLLQVGGCKASFAYSPLHGEMETDKLFSLLQTSCLPNTIINIQIHKYLGLK